MIKRPNTIKMCRLLEQLIECKLSDRETLRELQDDARRVLGAESKQPSRPAKRAVRH